MGNRIPAILIAVGVLLFIVYSSVFVVNERQQAIMVQLGCDELQGFLFAKPLTARALLLWAMDDRQQEAQSFATSLFASTRGDLDSLAPTRGNTAAFADTEKSPLTPLTHLSKRGAPQVH